MNPARGSPLARLIAVSTMRPMAKSTAVEDHFRAVEEAIAALESGDLPLEDALIRYEAGLKAVRQAKLLLDRYGAKLEELKAEPPAEPGA